MLSPTVMAALITVGLPLLAAAIGVLYRERKSTKQLVKDQSEAALKAAHTAGLEEGRAEAYKRQAIAAIDEKNREITELQADVQVLTQRLSHFTETEKPYLQGIIATQTATIDRLTESLRQSTEALHRLTDKGV